MRFKNDESGQVLVMTLLSMTILCGFMAMAIDVGMLFRAKRNVQIAADAAAVAGALAYAYPGTGVNATATSAAQAAASTNGVVASPAGCTGACTVVAVNTAPTDGFHTGAGYVEVDITQPNPTFFTGMITGGHTMNVSARAVAGTIPSPSCIYVLDPTGDNALYIKGNGSVVTPNCGIQVDSDSANAVCISGSASIDGPYLKIHGSQSSGGKCGKNPGTNVINGTGSVTDPYDDLKGPGPGGAASGFTSACPTPLTTATITGPVAGPGAGNAQCYSNPVTITNATFGAGVYVFEAGVTLSGNVCMGDTTCGATSAGATLDVEQGTFSQGNANLDITAPTTGTYNSIALMMPASNTESTCSGSISSVGGQTTAACLQVQFGSGTGNLNGIIYAPTATVWMQDQGGGVQAAGVVAYDLKDNSSLTITNNYNDANPSTTPLKSIAMVE
jgi:Flp pilus assembly protein TadG